MRELLEGQFARCSELEQEVLLRMAILHDPVTLPELRALLVAPPPNGLVPEALDSLQRRSMIVPGQRQGSFVLQSEVLDYITAVLTQDNQNVSHKDL